jgi:hypothetical protein
LFWLVPMALTMALTQTGPMETLLAVPAHVRMVRVRLVGEFHGFSPEWIPQEGGVHPAGTIGDNHQGTLPTAEELYHGLGLSASRFLLSGMAVVGRSCDGAKQIPPG